MTPLRSALVAAALFLATAAQAAPPVADTLAQRLQACMGCHGQEGRAGPDGYYPRIAGKPAGYLFHQLRNFRDGRRHYPLMTGLLEHMDDAYLREIADHFAAQDAPYAPQPATPTAAATLARGRALVWDGDAAKQIPACVSCHGTALMGVAPAVPGLLGLPRDYLNGQLGAWQTGNRRADAPDCMAQIAKRLSLDDLNAASSFLASLAVPADHRPAPPPPGRWPMPCGGVPGASQ